jgi:hypothetical protein
MPYKDRDKQREYIRNWRESLHRKENPVDNSSDNTMKPSILLVNPLLVDLLVEIRKGLIEIVDWTDVELDKIEKERG